MNQPIIRINHVYKEYRLGQIGGTTLREELQRLGARLRKREDPIVRIGATKRSNNERFLALEDVAFDVMPGERVGIIGRNGAGKSTLLKLISRITAPTKGWIGLNGNVASMLEVGTGFHGELTGRENIYLNGAILGMKVHEIKSRIDQIIEFSECSQFIDTPVKRYSSGMYVKLAFSVAAHLDSEIMIMDEVLAVGDRAFQKKCLDKMTEVSEKEGRTILYVSHNMHTIRRLCSRGVMLEHGKVTHDGDVEEAIRQYTGAVHPAFSRTVDLRSLPRVMGCTGRARFVEAFIESENNKFSANDSIEIKITLDSSDDFGARFMLILFHESGTRVGKTESMDFRLVKGLNEKTISVPLEGVADGSYYYEITLWHVENLQIIEKLDSIADLFPITVVNPDAFGLRGYPWRTDWYAHVMFKPILVR